MVNKKEKPGIEVVRDELRSRVAIGKLTDEGYYRGYSNELAAEGLVWNHKHLRKLISTDPRKATAITLEESGKILIICDLETAWKVRDFLDTVIKEAEYWKKKDEED